MNLESCPSETTLNYQQSTQVDSYRPLTSSEGAQSEMTLNYNNLGELKCAVFNAGGLQNHLDNILSFMHEHNIDVFFVTETWNHENSRVPTRHVKSLCSAERKFGQSRGNAGCAVVVKDPSLRVETLSIDNTGKGEYLWVKIRGVVYGTFYLPPSKDNIESIELIKTQFNLMLEAGHEQIVIVGDLNAHSMVQTGDKKTDPRGRLLFGMADRLNLVYARPSIGKWTFRGHNSESIVDYVFGHDTQITNVICHDTVLLGSGGHYAISFTAHSVISSIDDSVNIINELVNVDKLEEPELRKKLSDKCNMILIDSYPEASSLLARVKSAAISRFTAADLNNQIDSLLGRIGRQLVEAGKGVLGTRIIGKGTRQPKLTSEALRYYQKRAKKAHSKWLCTGNEVYFAEMVESQQGAAIALQDCRKKSFEVFAKDIDTLPANKQAKMIKKVIVGRKRSAPLLKSSRDDMETCKNHFENMFSNPRQPPPDEKTDWRLDSLPVHQEAESIFSLVNISVALKDLPNWKAPGNSGLVNELLNCTNILGTTTIQCIFQALFITGHTPRNWKVARICPVPKKGDLTKIENYRPISLLENFRKLYERCLDGYLKDTIQAISIEQAGFRQRHSTLDQVLALHETIQGVRTSLGKPPLVAYLDIKAAYDSVPRTVLWRRCIQKGMSLSMVANLRELFDHNVSTVCVNGVETPPIAHVAGVQQGSILSPLLYSIFIDDLACTLREKGPTIKMNTVKINCFLYADDIALVGTSTQHLQTLLSIAELHAKDNFYMFNVKKCVAVVSTRNKKLKLQGVDVPVADSFCYLGITMNKFGIATSEHVKESSEHIISKTIPYYVSSGMNFRGFNMRCRTSMYKTFIRSKLEYGTAIMDLNASAMYELQKAQNLALKRSNGVNKSTITSTIHLVTGTPMMSARVDFLKARYLVRYNSLPLSFLVRQIGEWARTNNPHTSLIKKLFDTCEFYKYNLVPSFPEGPPLFICNAQVKEQQYDSMRDIASEIMVAGSYAGHLNIYNVSKNVCPLFLGIADNRVSRTILLWILKKFPGKPRDCNRCNFAPLICTQTHIAECGGIRNELYRHFNEYLPQIPDRYLVEHYLTEIQETPNRLASLDAIANCIRRAVSRCINFNLEDITSERY